MRTRGSAARHARNAAAAVALAVAVMGWTMPAAAQFSQGYKFLEAVRKKDGNAVDAALNVPGSTIVNTRDGSTGETALHIVTQRRDLTWMNFLLQKGAHVDARDRNGATPLQVAANVGFIEGVQLLVDYKADPDQPNDTGETPLITAVHRRNTAMMRILLSGGADPDRPDSSGRSARDYAKLDGSDQLTNTITTYAKGKGARAAQSYGPKL